MRIKEQRQPRNRGKILLPCGKDPKVDACACFLRAGRDCIEETDTEAVSSPSRGDSHLHFFSDATPDAQH
jgi:hypothetical protein